MAQKVNIILVDDLDGGSADENVKFALDGASYEIDLSAANAAELREVLQRYVDAGRKASGGRTVRAKSTAGSRNNDSAQIRQWARDNGYTVNSRGRIQAEIQEAFHKANS
ncbi:Nucleoid-associated protein Lsr2 [Arthrobacter ulcerisalmonis]|uniref:Nucleoid-associated protein Lsr2 n=1 Tax=Arthrobacter ulcerisalmonis TaxID=2483813 RepID=A0A3P5WAY1_9MICC|nr:Lsr2 family protein [Arthrobacter ulcerisalmonis]VDC18331.1 Nucleoid-associated protein Lsr2 [Arthrobacter ulcerisalmonis]